MAENKTRPTDQSVAAHIAALPDEAQRRDCQTLVKLMKRVTGHKPRMWGPTIVGFGRYHYRYASGREGDACLVGFASRQSQIVLYVLADYPEQEALLAQLGKHKTTKACLYIRRLSDVNLAVLERMITSATAAARARHHSPG